MPPCKRKDLFLNWGKHNKLAGRKFYFTKDDVTCPLLRGAHGYLPVVRCVFFLFCHVVVVVSCVPSFIKSVAVL